MRHELIFALIRWADLEQLPLDRAPNGDIAIFSPDRLHRYVLTRWLGPSPIVLAGIGLNPSTADAEKPDRTVDRLKGFGRSWGCGLYVMLNAYGYRTKKPKIMWQARRDGVDIVGARNDAAIAYVLERLAGGTALACWGANAEAERASHLAELARSRGVRLQCLGTNKDGSPGHPLYLKGTTERRPYNPPAAPGALP